MRESEGSRRFISYRDMSVQQLGSIYERLLEREPVRNDEGRVEVRLNSYARKDSGSFFTPQELVDLIVDRTLKPLAEERLTGFKEKSEELRSDRRPISERRADLMRLDPAEAVLELKVLDPAMGSGHFLVTAVDFLSDQIADLVEEAPSVPDWLEDEYVSPLVGRVDSIRRDIVTRARESGWTIDEAAAHGPGDHKADGAEAVHLRRGQEPADRWSWRRCRCGCTASRWARRCRSWTITCAAGTRWLD